MNDAARKDRQQFLRTCEGARNSVARPTNEDKLARAVAYLGEKYVLHPNYRRCDHPEHTDEGSAILREVFFNAKMKGRI